MFGIKVKVEIWFQVFVWASLGFPREGSWFGLGIVFLGPSVRDRVWLGFGLELKLSLGLGLLLGFFSVRVRVP